MFKWVVVVALTAGCLSTPSPSADLHAAPNLSIYEDCAWTFPDGSIPGCAPDTMDGTPVRAAPLADVPQGWFCRLWTDDDEEAAQWRLYVRPYEDPEQGGRIDPDRVQLGLWWNMPEGVSSMRGILGLVGEDDAPRLEWEGGPTGFVIVPFGAPRMDTLLTGVLVAWPPVPSVENLTVDAVEPFWHLHSTNVTWPRFWPIPTVESDDRHLYLPVTGTRWDSPYLPSMEGSAHWGMVPDAFSSDMDEGPVQFHMRHVGYSIDSHMEDALDPVWLRCGCHFQMVPPRPGTVACLLPTPLG